MIKHLSLAYSGTLFLLLIWLLTSCNGSSPNTVAIPTQVAVAQLPTLSPTAVPTTLPATLDLSSLAPTPEPTAVLPPSAAATPRPTATLPPSFVNISDPATEATVLLGSDITVRGLAQLAPSQTISLTLRALNGRLLTETVGLVEDTFWQARLRIPEFVSGSASLIATVTDNHAAVISDTVPIQLTLDPTTTDRYLVLFRPQAEETAVAGYNLFFDGNAQRPGGSFVNIAVFGDDCQTRLASQSYPLRGSGYWQAFLILPPTAAGPVCAIAGFGTPGEDTWREVQLPLTVLPSDDPEAKGITIGNPPPEAIATAGKDLFIYGTAFAAQLAPVRVSILLENGRIISETDSSTDFWGYWEQAIFLPVDVEGPAQVTVTVGEPDDPFYSQTSTTIIIELTEVP